MPIYEYRCASCGHVFEEIQRFSDPDPDSCPSCKAKEVSRLISKSSFHLRGGGWFAEDYGSTGASTSATPSTAGTDSASADSTSPVTESKSSGGESKSTPDKPAKSTDPAAAG